MADDNQGKDKLLHDIQDSISSMQNQFKNAYEQLSSELIHGESLDKTVKVTMTATYTFHDIEFDESALQGGVKEFKWRIKEAMKDLFDKVQKLTQDRTLSMLQNMPIPQEIKDLPVGKDEDESGES